MVSADGAEPGLLAITQALDVLGTPYTVHIATTHRGGVVSSFLAHEAHGFYQGVILTTGSLAYFDGQAYVSALSPEEWRILRRYETEFGIREVAWYTYPTAEYGFQPPREVFPASSEPVFAAFTPAGSAVFNYLNTLRPFEISHVHTYLARMIADNMNTPLLLTDEGHALAVVHTANDGHQSLALTFDGNAYITHTLALAQGLINWVTRGLFLGERHVLLSPEIDDVGIAAEIWRPATSEGSCSTYRITGDDLQCIVRWQRAKQQAAMTQGLRLSMVYNGQGSTATDGRPDSLMAAIDRYQSDFNWINHTYGHLNLDDSNYAEGEEQIRLNNAVARVKGFERFNPFCMVTPDVSGLANLQFLRAAYDNGIRYLVTDTSRPGYDTAPPNAAIRSTCHAGILLVPRHPTNLYYDVSTPAEWLAEDHSLYPPDRSGHAATYERLLDRESSVLLRYLLLGDWSPLMFHQANLRVYDRENTLLTDLLEATLAAYERIFTLPLESLPLEELGRRMAERAAFDSAGVRAFVTRSAAGRWQTLALQAKQACVVPVTGLRHESAEYHGSRPIAHIPLEPGESTLYEVPEKVRLP